MLRREPCTEHFKAGGNVVQPSRESGDGRDEGLVGLDEGVEYVASGDLLGMDTGKIGLKGCEARINCLKTLLNDGTSCRQLGNSLTKGTNLWQVSCGSDRR